MKTKGGDWLRWCLIPLALMVLVVMGPLAVIGWLLTRSTLPLAEWAIRTLRQP